MDTDENIISIINDCKITSDQSQKSSLLSQIYEIILNRGNLKVLKQYWRSLLEFEADPSPIAKKWLPTVLSAACKKDINCKNFNLKLFLIYQFLIIILDVYDSIDVLNRLLNAESAVVVKSAIMNCSNVYPRGMVIMYGLLF